MPNDLVAIFKGGCYLFQVNEDLGGNITDVFWTHDPAKAIKFRNIPSVHDRAKALGAEIRPVTPPEPKHTLTVIGWMGTKRAYLDVTEEEAIRRYCETEGTDPEMLKSDGLKAETFPFTDEFCVYDAWMSR